MVKAKKMLTLVVSVVLIFSMSVSAFAVEPFQLYGVKAEMGEASYWSNSQEVLMTYEEIQALNAQTIATKGTNMYDLKNQPEKVNGVALNEALIKSTTADANYYLGWTYFETTTKATKADFEPLIANTQNIYSRNNQPVRYGIAVNRSELRAFPSPVAIWDDINDVDFDYQYLVGIRVNEPLIITSVSKDGKYYLAKNVCCSGWIAVEDVAICSDKNEWLSAWDIASEDALVVWGDRVYTENSVAGAQTSNQLLTMGTVLKLAKDIDPNQLIDNRAAYNNYVVYMPIREEDGSYGEKLTLISQHKDVHAGYLPLTEANLSKVALSALGNVYGWGGSMLSEDCSGYVRNIYKCFGLELARNTTWQQSMPMAKVDMKNMCREERILFLDALPVGSILFISGHEMLYLGKENNQYYVINSVGTIIRPEAPGVRQRIRGIVINTLDTQRTNGNKWVDELVAAVVPYWNKNENPLPAYQWYHDGVTYCLKNDLMNHQRDENFHPETTMTWAEVLYAFWSIADIEVPKGDTPYTDSDYRDMAVVWAQENHLISEDVTQFAPEKAITGEQVADVLYRFAKYQGVDVSVGESTNILSYDDAFDLSEYAIPAVQWIVGADIIYGDSQRALNLTQNASKGQIAMMLYQYNNFAKENKTAE